MNKEPLQRSSSGFAFMIRHLEGEERRLKRLAEDLSGRSYASREDWLALIERATFCLRWVQERLGGNGAGAPALKLGGEPRSSHGSPPAALPLPSNSAHSSGAPQPMLDPSGSALSGVSSVVPIADVLSFLFGLRKSGLLHIEAGGEQFEVQLELGNVVYAYASAMPPGHRLGEVLVRLAALGEAELDLFLNRFKKADEKLGTILVDQGIIEKSDLEAALADQTQRIFDRVLGLEDARWSFIEGARRVETDDMRLNVIQLLLESARSFDESQRPTDS